MSRNSMPLRELPCLQGSMLSQSNRTVKRKACLSEGLDTELTPSDLIQQWSPTHKLPRLAKGKENTAGGHFVLARRYRRKRESSPEVSWDQLPDELLLRILLCLPLQDLLRGASVCRRWHRLAFDESLWHSVDLVGLTHTGPALQQVLKTAVRRLRCPRSFVEEEHFTCPGPLQLLELDVSGSIMPTSALESVVTHCQLLQCVSLEGLQLSDSIISSLSQNTHLLQLNVSGCSGFSATALAHMITSCSRLEHLNMSWCDFTSNHVKSVVENLPSSVSHLNLSGYRESLTLEDVKVLVTRCPNITTLDLSDSTLLMADCFPVLKQLKHLVHLSLSRCYHIHLAALTDVGATFPLLYHLDVFGLVPDGQLSSLQKEMPRVSINSRPFSSVARPTPASTSTSTPLGSSLGRSMWGRECQLRVTL